MGTYYLDYENGSDSNDGSGWGANAWKTITSGATAARIAPGDVIRIAKSPDPTSTGQNATWTAGSATITLTTAVTKEVCDCSSAWTASTDVTAYLRTGDRHRLGTNCVELVVAAAFTTGKIAYFALGASEDFSSYEQLSFYIKAETAPGITAGQLSLRLCSDTTGDSTVDTFAIPATGDDDVWVAFTVDSGAALGSAIQSIALYADTDPGAQYIFLDHIIACKDSTAVDSISLTSLISKNSAAQGGTEAWYPVGTIVGTTIKTKMVYNETIGNEPKYAGTTETVALYKRETIKTTPAAATTTQVQAIQDSGTFASRIEFQGGWDTGTTTQDGETFFDGQNGRGYGLYCGAKNFITLNRLNFLQYNVGLYLSAGDGFNLENLQTISTCTTGFQENSYLPILTNIENIINCMTWNLNESFNSLFLHIGNLSSCTNGSGIVIGNSIGPIILRDVGIIKYCQNYGIVLNASGAEINNAEISNNGTASVQQGAGGEADVHFYNCIFGDTTEVVPQNVSAKKRVTSTRHDQTDSLHKIWENDGTIVSQTTVRHTAAGIAWQLSPTSSDRNINWPLELKIHGFAVAASSLVTVKVWVRRDHTDITARLILKSQSVQGVTTEVTDTISAAADTWEELEVTFTPTSAGETVDVFVQAYYAATGTYTRSVYVDDITISQA